jgi:phosphatidylserine synthase
VKPTSFEGVPVVNALVVVVPVVPVVFAVEAGDVVDGPVLVVVAVLELAVVVVELRLRTHE